METVFKILDILDVLLSLLVLVAAITTAVRCGQKKLAPVAAWVMTAGFALALLSSLGNVVSNFFLLDALGSSNFSIYRVVLVVFYLVALLGLVAVAAGVGMFTVKPAAPAQEPSHG